MISPTVVEEVMAASGMRRPISWENRLMNCRFDSQRIVSGIDCEAAYSKLHCRVG
jgi:hypothetical protein